MQVVINKKTAILSEMLKWMTIFGSLAYIPSLIACMYEELYLLAVIDTVCYAALLGTFVAKTSHLFRFISVLVISLILGGTVLIITGTDGAGHLWLLFAVFVAALFGRLPAIIITICFTQLILLSYAALNYFGFIRHDASLASMLAISSNMLIISSTLALIVHYLLESLSKELGQREGLLRLLRHRIMNNMQTMESLISLENHGPYRTGELSRRIQTLSMANNLLLGENGYSGVDLVEILRLIDGNCRIEVTETARQIRISAEQLTEVTIGFSDLITMLKPYAPFHIVIGESVKLETGKDLPAKTELDQVLSRCLLPETWINRNETGSRMLKIHL